MTEFCIMPCKLCGRTPTINKNLEIIGEDRYTLSHCNISANGFSETGCIVHWNKLQNEETDNDEQ